MGSERPQDNAALLEQALADSRRRLEAALTAGEIGTWVYELRPDKVFADPNLLKLFNVTASPAEAATGLPLERFLDKIHPDDRADVAKNISGAIASHPNFYSQYRICTPEGDRWVVARGTVERDEHGHAVRLPGVVVDVTARKRAEAGERDLDRRLSEQVRLFDAVVNSISDPAYIFDLQGRCLFANKRLLRLWNRTLEQAVGKTWAELDYSPALVEQLMSDFARVAETRQPVRGDVEAYDSPSGFVASFEHVFSPVFDENDRVIGIAGSSRDITDRKRAEAALTATSRQRDALLELQRAVTTAATDADEDSTAVLSVAADRVLAAVPQAHGSAIEIVERNSAGEDHLVYRAVGGSLKPFLGMIVARHQSLSGRCLDEGRPLVCDDCEVDERVDRDGCRRSGVRSMVVVPITRGGVSTGVLKLASKVAGAFGEADVLTIQLAVGSIVTGLSGAAEARAIEALRRSEAELRELADAMPQMVWGARPDGLIEYFNRRWYEYSGEAEGTVGEVNWGRLLHPSDLPRVNAVWAEAVRRGEPFVDEQRYRRASDGTFRWHLVRGLPIRDAAGQIVRWLGTSTDIDDRKQAETERQALLERERAARTEAEHAGRMKDEFLATLSHELRTPLNAIVGWVQILRSSSPGVEDLEEGLAIIERNARAQSQIIEDILDMSRIISGKLRLDVQRVDLATLVRAGVDTVQPAADAKGVRLQVLLDPAAGPVSGDPNRLHQVFWNLLSNAVKFTPRDGRVQIVLERVNSHVEVSVIDTGEGIEPGFLPFVFDRFRQADSSTTRSHGGLGLGLAIVKQLVELHGGSVGVKSPGSGQGSTFVVMLPLTVLQATHADPGETREHPRSPVPVSEHRAGCGQLDGISVVVVDDEPDGRLMVRRLLEECGARVRVAGSAAEALQLIAEQTPTVLVSDVGMPGEDGYSLIRHLRRLPADRGGSVPAVALTAYARAADRVRALESGFQLHLAKPVEPAELIVTVATAAKTAFTARG